MLSEKDETEDFACRISVNVLGMERIILSIPGKKIQFTDTIAI